MSKLDKISDWERLLRDAQFRVGRLAELCGVGERELRRYLRARLGLRPRDWILKIRLRPAPQLLRDGYSVKQAAAETGFKEQGRFSKCFEREFGMKPGVYARSSHRPPDH
jgi:transcriptional regulator GlxA family with amidase domain